jgi:hypothetical protein
MMVPAAVVDETLKTLIPFLEKDNVVSQVRSTRASARTFSNN